MAKRSRRKGKEGGGAIARTALPLKHGNAAAGHGCLADQSGQVGNDQNQRSGKQDKTRLPDLWLSEHGYLPILLVGVAASAAHMALNYCVETWLKPSRQNPAMAYFSFFPLFLLRLP